MNMPKGFSPLIQTPTRKGPRTEGVYLTLGSPHNVRLSNEAWKAMAGPVAIAIAFGTDGNGTLVVVAAEPGSTGAYRLSKTHQTASHVLRRALAALPNGRHAVRITDGVGYVKVPKNGGA
jgi:hypothetical protein